VQVNAEMLREGLRDIGCEVRGEGHIVPWFIGDDATVDYVSQVLERMRESSLPQCVAQP
jgi:hypothetical protein